MRKPHPVYSRARVGAIGVAVLAMVAGLVHVPAQADDPAGPYAILSGSELRLGNGLVERRWATSAGLRTTKLTDQRGSGREWASQLGPDFTLLLPGRAPLASNSLTTDRVVTKADATGARVSVFLTAPGLSVERTVEVFPGIAGFRGRVTVTPTGPLALAGAIVESIGVGNSVAPTTHALRAGADWREPDGSWAPAQAIGDPHLGTWRDTRTAPAGTALAGPAQWLSMAAPPAEPGRTLAIVLERNDMPSSRAAYDGASAQVLVDYGRDIVSLGPLEEDGHAENPSEGPGRVRTLPPGQPFAFEPTFLALGAHDGDEAWQVHAWLTRHRLAPYRHEATFNSNGTDSNRISTGAKDDMDLATVQAVAPIAKRLGIDTFILDDGWQAISGDWYPDSPAHPEPRWDGTPTSKFKPRFPDSTFKAVREAIAPMRLGLWMSPMHFNPKSATYAAHPEWACTSTGHALAAANMVQPDSSSNEAGIGQWSALALPHVESRIKEAITAWGVEYFKFDFLVWFDCPGQGDMYEMHDAFLAMLDRLNAAHPHVTFQIDETNDYRLFPFESVSRGPSWFQNGSPDTPHLLHNLWNLSPFVPTASLGQHFLGGKAWTKHPIDTLGAVALLSHVTYFSELRDLPLDVADRAAVWLAFARDHRDQLDGVVYPLLADPLARGWTALQSWDPEAGSGVLLAFRQLAPEASATIALRNVADGTYRLRLAPDGGDVGTFTGAQLRAGLRVDLPAPDTAAVYTIERAG